MTWLHGKISKSEPWFGDAQLNEAGTQSALPGTANTVSAQLGDATSI